MAITTEQLLDKIFQGRTEVSKDDALAVIGKWIQWPGQTPMYHLRILVDCGWLRYRQWPDILERWTPEVRRRLEADGTLQTQANIDKQNAELKRQQDEREMPAVQRALRDLQTQVAEMRSRG